MYLKRKEFPSIALWPLPSRGSRLDLLTRPRIFYYLSVTAAEQRGGGSLQGTGSWMSQSISVCQAIDCAWGRRWRGSILMSDRWEPFDSQHMASRSRTMMRGQRQLVGVTRVDPGGWMKAEREGVGSPGQSPPKNRLSLSLSPSIICPALWLA